jgi:aminoglycoside phosphotransferase
MNYHSAMELPVEIQALVDIGSREEVRTGESKSRVFRISGKTGQLYYLKVSNSNYVAKEIVREAEILEWLSHRCIPAPSKVALVHFLNQTYFLTTEVEGRSMANAAADLDPKDCMRMGAEFLGLLHKIDIRSCPFDRRLHVTRELAAANLNAGLVDEGDFDQDNQNKTADQLFREISASMDIQEDLVFTHGDYCFPNIIVKGKSVSGVIDLGRAGVADRYQDIGLFLRSFKSNIANPDLNLFLDSYSLIDKFETNKATFYRKLDEFF